MTWRSSTVSLGLTCLVFVGLQLWWIGALLQRNKRRRGAEPLSSEAFRQELERIFRNGS